MVLNQLGLTWNVLFVEKYTLFQVINIIWCHDFFFKLSKVFWVSRKFFFTESGVEGFPLNRTLQPLLELNPDAILTLAYPCPNKDKGCEWTGKENDKSKHLQNECTFDKSFKIHSKKKRKIDSIRKTLNGDDDDIQMISQIKIHKNEFFHPTLLIQPDQNFQPGDFAISKDQLLGEVNKKLTSISWENMIRKNKY